MDSDTKKLYDLTAESVANVWYGKDILMPTLKDLLSLLPPQPQILDLGCGPGHESMRMASLGAQVVGVDFSTECIRVARERCPQCRFEVLDFRQLDRRFGQFDGAFAAGSLIHIRPQEMPDVLERVAQVLTEGGYLMAIVQDGQGVRESRPVVQGQELRRSVYLYSREELIRAADRFRYVRYGYLDYTLGDGGWRCYIFQLEGADQRRGTSRE
jgi:ubiquinone/menaquinone biosynthesis C-methylase UbiE